MEVRGFAFPDARLAKAAWEAAREAARNVAVYRVALSIEEPEGRYIVAVGEGAWLGRIARLLRDQDGAERWTPPLDVADKCVGRRVAQILGAAGRGEMGHVKTTMRHGEGGALLYRGGRVEPRRRQG